MADAVFRADEHGMGCGKTAVSFRSVMAEEVDESVPFRNMVRQTARHKLPGEKGRQARIIWKEYSGVFSSLQRLWI